MSTTLDETNRELDAARIMQSNQHAELQRIHEENERLSAKVNKNDLKISINKYFNSKIY